MLTPGVLEPAVLSRSWPRQSSMAIWASGSAGSADVAGGFGLAGVLVQGDDPVHVDVHRVAVDGGVFHLGLDAPAELALAVGGPDLLRDSPRNSALAAGRSWRSLRPAEELHLVGPGDDQPVLRGRARPACPTTRACRRREPLVVEEAAVGHLDEVARRPGPRRSRVFWSSPISGGLDRLALEVDPGQDGGGRRGPALASRRRAWPWGRRPGASSAATTNFIRPSPWPKRSRASPLASLPAALPGAGSWWTITPPRSWASFSSPLGLARRSPGGSSPRPGRPGRRPPAGAVAAGRRARAGSRARRGRGRGGDRGRGGEEVVGPAGRRAGGRDGGCDPGGRRLDELGVELLRAVRVRPGAVRWTSSKAWSHLIWVGPSPSAGPGLGAGLELGDDRPPGVEGRRLLVVDQLGDAGQGDQAAEGPLGRRPARPVGAGGGPRRRGGAWPSRQVSSSISSSHQAVRTTEAFGPGRSSVLPGPRAMTFEVPPGP